MPSKALRMRQVATGGGGGIISPFYPTTLYSLRLRKLGYAGACIRIKRSSDSTETDIGFVAGDYVDGAAALAFVGTGGSDQGYVTKWYDQSGGGVDLSDTTSTVKIVTNGVLHAFSGKPALLMNVVTPSALGAAANAAFAFGTGAWTWEWFGVPTNNSGVGQAFIDFRDGGSGVAALYNAAGTNPTLFDGSNHGAGTPEITFNSMMYQAASYVGGGGSNMRIFTAGVLSYTEAMTLSFSGSRPLVLGAAFNGTVAWTGLVVELRITNGACQYTATYPTINYYA